MLIDSHTHCFPEKIALGADKLLFGTDTPWHTLGMELRLLRSLGLSATEFEKITCGNAKKLLGM